MRRRSSAASGPATAAAALRPGRFHAFDAETIATADPAPGTVRSGVWVVAGRPSSPGPREGRVDLVRHDAHPVPRGERQAVRQLRARVRGPRRVLRVAHEPDGAAPAPRAVTVRGGTGRVGERPLQGVEVETPVGAQRRVDDAAPLVRGEAVERRVHGRVDDDRVARGREDAQHLDDRDHDVGQRARRRRVGRPAPAAPGEARVRLAVRGADVVPGVARAQGGRHGVHDRVARRDVHLGDEQRQHVGGEGAPLHRRPTAQLVEREDVQRCAHRAPPRCGPSVCPAPVGGPAPVGRPGPP